MTTLRRLHNGWRRVRGSAVRVGLSRYEVNLKDNGFRWRKKKSRWRAALYFTRSNVFPAFAGFGAAYSALMTAL